jgi:hypothetical protein
VSLTLETSTLSGESIEPPRCGDSLRPVLTEHPLRHPPRPLETAGGILVVTDPVVSQDLEDQICYVDHRPRHRRVSAGGAVPSRLVAGFLDRSSHSVLRVAALRAAGIGRRARNNIVWVSRYPLRWLSGYAVGCLPPLPAQSPMYSRKCSFSVATSTPRE